MDRTLLARHALTALTFALAAATIAPAAFADGDRVVRSTEGFSRDSSGRGKATIQQLEERKTPSEDIIAKPRASAPLGSIVSGDQWIYDADVELFDDFDNDGYFRYLSVRFDADTYLASSYVYAMLFLSYDGETWEHFYTTDDFLIEGSTADDEYYVETELVSGYGTGLYDILIELYDADLGIFVDEFGPNESSAMSLLPLEDADSDQPEIVISVSHNHGGGAAGWPLLTLLTAAAAFRRRGLSPKGTVPGARR